MTNTDLKRRIAMTGMTRTEFAVLLDREARKGTAYHVSLPDLSRVYNSNGKRLTEKESWILETALMLLRKIEAGEIDPYGKERV